VVHMPARMPRSERDAASRRASSKAEAAVSPKGPTKAAAGGAVEAEIPVNEADSRASKALDASPGPSPEPRGGGAAVEAAGAPLHDELELAELAPPDARDLHHGIEDRELDSELVRRAQTGDHGAFRQLFDRYPKRVFTVAFGVLKNRPDAADRVPDGFVKVHRHLPSFQGSSSFYTWLYRIVMNLAIDQLRRRKAGRPVEFDDGVRRDSQEPGEDAVAPRTAGENPRKGVIRAGVAGRGEAALAELPEYHRQVILLREIEGMSYEEMAEALDVPKGTIMSRLFHARKKMQDALRGYVDGDLDIEE